MRKIHGFPMAFLWLNPWFSYDLPCFFPQVSGVSIAAGEVRGGGL
jgi:hypothetical protein